MIDTDKMIVSLIHQNKDKRYYNWGEYIKEVERLAQLISKSGEKFNYIIAVSRGGMFVGDIVSRALGIKYGIVKVSSYDDQTNCQDKTQLKNIKAIVDGKLCNGKVLVIDDLVDSGSTLNVVCKYLNTKYMCEVKTAVLWERVSETTLHQSDFCCNRIDQANWKWIVQPNELYQDLLI